MSFRDCVETNVRKSKFKQDLLKNATDDDLVAKALNMVRERRQDMMTTIQDARKLEGHLENIRKNKRRGLTTTEEKHNPHAYAPDMVADGELSGSIEGTSMANRAETLMHASHGELGGYLNTTKEKSIGGKLWSRRGAKANEEIATVIHGGKTTNELANAFGAAFKKLTQKFATMLNETGMHINLKDDFYMPHKHAADKVRKAEFKQWSTDIKEHFRTEDMVYEGSTETVDELLQRMYNNITNPTNPGASSLREMQRRLVVKDGKEWFKYNEKYGDTDIFGSVMHYIQSTSHEIAARETFGSKPREMVERLVKEAWNIETELVGQGKKVSRSAAPGNSALHIYDNLMGFQEYGKAFWSKPGQALRTSQVVTKMGLGSVTALTDVGFSYSAAAMKGMPILKTIRTQLVEVATRGNRDFLSQLGVIADVVIDDVQQAHRMADVAGNGTSMKIAHAFTRLIGLNRWTTGMKSGHMYQLLAHLTNIVDGSMQMNEGMRLAIAKYGIDEGVLSHLGTVGRIKNKGANFIDIPSIKDQDVATRVLSMIHAETRLAVPESTARSRAALNWGTAPGTFQGELIRTMGQYKTFPITIIQMHSATYRSLPVKSLRAKYLATLLGGTTVMGAVSAWIKDLLNGKDPQDITPEFAWRALVQGGAGGPLVDMLAHTGEYGGKVQDFLGGPSAGVFNFLITCPKDLIKERDFEKTGGKVASTMLKQVGQAAGPLKLLFNRLWLDGLRAQADPAEYRKRMREQHRMWDKGQDFYWKVGQPTPSRAPKLPKPLGD